MTDALLYYTYGYVTLEAIFIAGAAFYCYRLTKITGAFRAWILMVAALAVLAFGVLASYFRMILFEPAATLEARVQASGPVAVVAGSAYGLVLSTLLFLSMFEMYRMFGRYKKSTTRGRLTPRSASRID